MTESPPSPSRTRRVLAFLLFLTLLGGCALTLLTYVAGDAYGLIVLASGRVQTALLFLLLGVLTWRLPSPGSRLLAALGFLLNAAPVLALWLPGDAKVEPGATVGEPVRVVTANLFFHNDRHADVFRALDRLDADVLVLTECTRPWAAALEKHREENPDRYPHAYVRTGLSVFSLAIVSRFPLYEGRSIGLTEGPIETASVSVGFPRGARPLIATHFLVPTSRISNGGHMRETEALIELVRKTSPAPIVVGDLNITPFATRFQRLLDETELRDSGQGFGWQPTFPARRLWSGVPIDHVLVPPGIGVTNRFTTVVPGSDHRAVVTDLVID